MKIDKVFSKLKMYEKQPSDVAWEKLNARLAQPKRRIVPLWYRYAVAASVLLMLGGVWLFHQPEIAQDLAKVEPKTVIENPPKIVIIPKTKVATLPENKIEKVIQKTILVAKKEKIDFTKPEENQRILPIIQQKEEIIAQELPKTTVVENPIISTPTLTEALNPNEIVAEVEPKILEKTYTITIDEPTQTDETLTLQPDKKRRFKLFGFFKQLKNMATGQKVDWNDAGVNPTRLIARADASIERGKDRIRK